MTKAKKMPPAVAPAEGLPSVQQSTRGNASIAQSKPASNSEEANRHNVAFRSLTGRIWRYKGKRGRVLAMLAESNAGITQWDTLPWHTRLGGTIHVLRRDGLSIKTKREGEFRHARYRLETSSSLLIQRKNSGAVA